MIRYVCDRCGEPAEGTQFPTVKRTYQGAVLTAQVYLHIGENGATREWDFCQPCVTYLCGELVNASRAVETAAKQSAGEPEAPQYDL